MGKFRSLGEISSDYELVIIDNSAFQEILISKSNPKSIKEKLENYLVKIESLKFWKENIGHYKNCYTISEVIEELRDTEHYPYKKTIKEDPKPYLLKLRRTIREAGKERNRLAACLEDKEKILERNKNEDYLYDIAYERYLELRNNYGLHGVAYFLFIHGVVAAQTRGSCAIVSNNSKISHAVDYVSETENLPREKFRFFFRNRISLFEGK